MDKPVVAGKSPIPAELKKDETYYFCTCGKSDNQPFCNGAHQVTAFSSMAFSTEKDETAYLCACKHTKNPPYCDGLHQNLYEKVKESLN